MSGDYRYQITEHQGIQCLHVIVEHDESDELHKAGMAHCYISVDDIQDAFVNYKVPDKLLQSFAKTIVTTCQTILGDMAVDRSMEEIPVDKYIEIFMAIVNVCTAQLPNETKKEQGSE